jgi:hypothetical protein
VAFGTRSNKPGARYRQADAQALAIDLGAAPLLAEIAGLSSRAGLAETTTTNSRLSQVDIYVRLTEPLEGVIPSMCRAAAPDCQPRRFTESGATREVKGESALSVRENWACRESNRPEQEGTFR